jgi:hypothetical protein
MRLWAQVRHVVIEPESAADRIVFTRQRAKKPPVSQGLIGTPIDLQ